MSEYLDGFNGYLDPTPAWVDVPKVTASTVQHIGGEHGAMNRQAMALTARLNYLAWLFSIEHINVKNPIYGAVGGGVIDDTAAINLALAAGAATGRPVYAPGDTYRTTDKLDIPSNVIFYGDGKSTIIKSTTLVNGGPGLGQRQIYADTKSGFQIRDMLFDTGELTGVVSGVRAMSFHDCSNYIVDRCFFVTCGAAVASIGCSHYRVQGNYIECESLLGTSHHDGVIDQWDGSSYFSVLDNTIIGNAIAEYPILVTGEATDGSPAGCHDFLIAGNKSYNSKFVGIWINGREGVNYNFHVTENTIDDVDQFFGIGIADCYAFNVANNIIRRVAAQGIILYKEASAGGVTSALNGTVSDNVIYDANQALSPSSSVGSAIVVDDECTGVTLSGNRVKGSTHVWAIWFDNTTFNNEVIGYNLDAGTQGIISNSVVSNTVPGGGTYTPTLTPVANVTASTAHAVKYERRGSVVTVTGRVEVQPTAAASTATQLGISLPIASNFTSIPLDASGQATSAFGLFAAIYADTVNDRVTMQFPATNTSNNIFYFTFTYTVK